MNRLLAFSGFVSMLLLARGAHAIDSYRYLHVSIDTPWMIFIFLLVAVFVPFVLMLVLMWWRPMHKSAPGAKPKIPDHE